MRVPAGYPLIQYIYLHVRDLDTLPILLRGMAAGWSCRSAGHFHGYGWIGGSADMGWNYLDGGLGTPWWSDAFVSFLCDEFLSILNLLLILDYDDPLRFLLIGI